jgi:hypothetical protein
MTSPARPSGELPVAVAGLQYGGLSGKGDDSAWCKSMACPLNWAPDVLLLQEMNGRAPERLHAHLWRTERAEHDTGPWPGQRRLGTGQPSCRAGQHRRRAADPRRRTSRDLPGRRRNAGAWCEEGSQIEAGLVLAGLVLDASLPRPLPPLPAMAVNLLVPRQHAVPGFLAAVPDAWWWRLSRAGMTAR